MILKPTTYRVDLSDNYIIKGAVARNLCGSLFVYT